MATLGLSKVFILDKYFTELQKFWETEKKLQDASSSNEAVHLQQRLKSLSTELVTLRNRLHVGPASPTGTLHGPNSTAAISPGSVSVAAAPLAVSTPASGQAHLVSSSAALLSTSPPSAGAFTASIPIKNQKPTYSNQTITAAAAAAAAAAAVSSIVSPRNTSIPHPLPPNVSSKNADNFSQFGGTLPRRSEATSTNANTTSNHRHTNGQNSNGTLSHAHATTTIDRRLQGNGGSNSHNYHNNSTQHSTGKTPFGGSCNNLIENCSSNGGGGKANNNQQHNGGGYGNNNDGGIGGVTVHMQPQTHWSHQNNVAAAAAAASGSAKSAPPKDMDDLIHLPGPLTEDAVMRTLQARFADGKHFTNVGPILLSINPYKDVGNPLTLSSTRSLQLAPQLHRIVQEAVRQQAETGYPQAIILSGTSGAGKTHCSMLLLRQLFAVAGGGPETDAFKHLAAAFTVLRSLGSAKTSTNSESSRIGQFIEVQVTDGALYRTKIHCYFLDQTRVIRPLPNEKNYHIFYQMLAGLNREERAKLKLEGYSPANLRYLQSGDIYQDEKADAARFQAWKACLGILGIPFLDVVRVLAAVLLLGNVQFVDGQGLEVDVRGESELNAVAGLLGVQPAALFRGLTTRTHNARGQLVKSVCDANISNMTRDSLAKALYCRTVATIVRRANSLKRLGSTLGTLSSDSNESVHNQADAASQHTSTIGGNAGSKSMAALNNAVRHATDGFIGILDMFGFEEPRPAQLEHLCINLCAETMQHFYNTHIFKSSVESCRDEGIQCDTEIDYVDNVPCIDLISSLRTGLLSMLDAECAVRGTAESYVAKIRVQHRNSTRLESRQPTDGCDPRGFVIRHFAGRVEYDTSDFLDTNRDVVSDDLVSVFYKHTCNFGFATHLFGSELKALYALEQVPRGLSFRIAPTSHTDLLNGDEPVSTLTQDFHTRLDNLLRTLVHARPHFVRCIRSNGTELATRFDRGTVVRQIRALQVLETVNLMASGFPHRMRFKQFAARYRMLAPFRLLRRCEEKAPDDCRLILECAVEGAPTGDGSVTLSWAPGKRHVFLSEGIRQHLEKLRIEIRTASATRVQAAWRGWQLRRRIGPVKRGGRGGNGNGGNNNGGADGGMAPVSAASCSALLKAAAASAAAATTAAAAVAAVAAAAATNVTAARNSSAQQTAAATTAKTTTNNTGTMQRPRPQPIAGTPPPDPNEKCDAKIIQQTCNMFGLDLERPPPVPPSRPYTVTGNSKLGYPQSRVMKMNFPEDSANAGTGAGDQLHKGDTVTVVGASHRRGHLIVENNGSSFHVPFQFMELVKGTAATATAPTLTSAAATSPIGPGATVAAIVSAAVAASGTANVANLM